MKKLYFLTICCVLGCSSGMNSPKSVAENFTENIAKGKVEEAKKYATESTGMMIDFASGFGGLPVDPNYEFEFLKDSIVDKRAYKPRRKSRNLRTC